MTVQDASCSLQSRSAKETRPINILHVEDNETVADVVKEDLEVHGWKIETCTDGTTAQKKIESCARYEILIFDNDLPGINGIELVRYARQLPHRRDTPIIVMSASDCEQDAQGAGADAFLRKPQDMVAISTTVKCLLIKMPDA